MTDENPKPMPIVRFGGSHRGNCRTYVQVTHRPTGQTAIAAFGGRGRDHVPLASKRKVALALLAGRIACSPQDRLVRTYDLTPGMMRAKGGGVDTADPLALLDRGELPFLPRRDDRTAGQRPATNATGRMHTP